MFFIIRQSVPRIPFIEVTAVEKQLEIVYIPEEDLQITEEEIDIKVKILKYIVLKSKEKRKNVK
jgi:hypothetical protein